MIIGRLRFKVENFVKIKLPRLFGLHDQFDFYDRFFDGRIVPTKTEKTQPHP